MRVARALFLTILALSFSVPSPAHEGHREDMSDEEMALEMAMGPVEAGHMDAHPEARMHVDEAELPEDAEAAVAQASEAAAAQPQLTAEETMAQMVAQNRATSIGDFLGRLHPVAVHFPIALFLVAALAELMLMFRPTLGLQAVIRFLVIVGGAGALLAAVLGWFGAGWRLTDRSETLFTHRWLGTGIAIGSLAAIWFATRKGDERLALRLVLASLAAGLIIQGYLGGEMVFGMNHLGIR